MKTKTTIKKVVVLEVEEISKPETVYNLTVENPHIFIADGVYTHNKNASP